MTANYIAGGDVYARWLDNLKSGTPPPRFLLGDGALGEIDFGPGRILLIGGAPGAGKTAFVMQCVLDALRLNPDLRALAANVEMSPEVLLDRQVSRVSGIPLSLIRDRQLDGDMGERLDLALAALRPAIERLAFLTHPFDLGRVASASDEFGARLLVLDYLQRFASQHGGSTDRRGSVDSVMSTLRAFASASRGIIAVSAVARSKDARGRSSYASSALNLASFRESSEIEFGADDAYILAADDRWGGLVQLKHLKSRYGETQDVHLRFERAIQRFTPVVSTTIMDGRNQVAELWDQTGAQQENEEVVP